MTAFYSLHTGFQILEKQFEFVVTMVFPHRLKIVSKIRVFDLEFL